jgi:hypothetical protein
MFEIQQEIISAWTRSRKTKHTQSGWISGNAVCCHHNGHSADQRGRGGMIANEGGANYHCFNCGFTAGWQPGRRINLKMRKLLGWMGVSEDDIRRLSLFALSNLDANLDIRKEAVKELPKYEPQEACPGHNILDWFVMQGVSDEDRHQLEEIVAYLDSRGLGDKLDQFNWHNDKDSPMYHRVLVPFTFLNQPMGYSGRLIIPGKRKYYTEHPPQFVFNYDAQLPNSKFSLVVEGILDAVAVDGIGVTSNECSEQQALVIDSLNREVIVVPDRDKAGMQLVKAAMNYGWNVAFPDWEPGIKDCADAVQKYGQLFTMRSILDSVETSNLKIQLVSRKWIGS